MKGKIFYRVNLLVIFVYLCLILNLFKTVFGQKNVARSYGGKFIKITKAPYVVLILMRIGQHLGKCTGSIIAEEWVLTAAHCVDDVDMSNVQVIAGIDDMTASDREGNQERVPLDVIVHPRYTQNGIVKWDMALIKVSAFNMNSKTVGILKIGDTEWPQDDRMYNRKCKALGWGLPDRYTKNNTRLHYTNVIAEHGRESCKCLKTYQKKRAVCLKRTVGEGICAGDSGGPLVCDNKAYGVAHIIYDISKCTMIDVPENIKCGRYSTVGVYTYTCPELKWLKSHVASVPEPPESCDAVTYCLGYYGTSVLVIYVFIVKYIW